MARSLFDPSKAAGAASVDPPSQAQQLTVAQAVNLIKTTLEQKIPSPLKIVGEVSNLRQNQHLYFSLKDADAVLHCVAWATAVRKFAFRPKDGDQIVATGQISHFAPQGRTQLYVTEIQAVGAGALEMKFRALCDELRGLGYFDEARKKPLPILPRRIAVITSATGAAVQDVINTAAHRCKAVGLIVVDVRVQGEGSAEEVARAIRWVDANRLKLGVDAMLVTRGGGSIEDLWAFNERVVADAVFRCELPVVAAIGHESDTTIIELVADVRASTPTQAAMRLVPSSQELCAQIDHLTHRLGTMVHRSIERLRIRWERLRDDLGRIALLRITNERARLERFAAKVNQIQPGTLLVQRRADLKSCSERLQRAMQRRIDQRERVQRLSIGLMQAAQRHVRRSREKLIGLQRHLSAIDPNSVLRRGYTLTLRPDRTLIRAAAEVAAGDELITQFADGEVHSTATDASANPVVSRQSDGQARNGGQSGAAAKLRRSAGEKADQMDLFNSPR